MSLTVWTQRSPSASGSISPSGADGAARPEPPAFARAQDGLALTASLVRVKATLRPSRPRTSWYGHERQVDERARRAQDERRQAPAREDASLAADRDRQAAAADAAHGEQLDRARAEDRLVLADARRARSGRRAGAGRALAAGWPAHRANDGRGPLAGPALEEEAGGQDERRDRRERASGEARGAPPRRAERPRAAATRRSRRGRRARRRSRAQSPGAPSAQRRMKRSGTYWWPSA